MAIGFLIVVRDGQVEARTYLSEIGARIPLVDHAHDGELDAILVGRLYYRDDVARRLGLDARAPANGGDAARVLAAYRQRGVAGIEALEGEFTAAVVDVGQRRVVALRDPMGGYPLFWIRRPGIVALATAIRPLLDFVPEHAPNPGLLGEIQMIPFAEVDYLEETAFRGVQRVASGARVVVDAAAATLEVRPYWHWPDHIEDPGTDRLDDVADGFRQRLGSAVAERARGTVSAHLSGGMDSTAVALLARDAIAPEGRRVHALSLVYERLPYLRDEAPYIDGPLASPGIEAHRIVADDILDFDGFRDPPLHDEPYHGLFRAALGIATVRAAEAARADTILSGLGADELVANRPYQIADRLRRGNLAAAWSEAARWGRAKNSSSWLFFRIFGLQPLVPVALQPGFGAFLRGGYAGARRLNTSTIPPWVLPEFARAGQLRERSLDAIPRNSRGQATVVRAEALARLRYSAGDWERHVLAAPLGILTSHPFRDPRVIGFSLGARDRVEPIPRQQKVLLATAMRDVLPGNILHRRSKVDFNPVYYEGLARNLPMLESLVRNSDAEHAGLFRKDVLLDYLRQAALGTRGLDALSAMNNSLVILAWLEQLARWKLQCPRGNLLFARALAAAPASDVRAAGR